MGIDSPNTNADILSQCGLDGTELHDSSGQIIGDITEVENEILKDLIQESLALIEVYKSKAKYWEGMYKGLDSYVKHNYKDF